MASGSPLKKDYLIAELARISTMPPPPSLTLSLAPLTGGGEFLDPEGMAEAFKDAQERGHGWRKNLKAGQKAMERLLGNP